MKVFDLRCAKEHTFEGWFGSEDDYLSQQARGLVSCPVCGETEIVRMPSAPRLNLSGATPPVGEARARAGGGTEGTSGAGVSHAPVPPELAEARRELQSLWMKAVRHVMANTEDVGANFAEEARKIHYHEAPERNIRGTASREEARALAEEGIEVMMLPLPDSAKETLQ
ncbi:DUF1178 family protein [Pandoraea nosoerga]|uniref:DUF1178 domain-containing protein n=1 Tax=Pandoraea nosoerga TaxID=2508296 RepID=A0A5E4TXI1_9BURK|nr:DUF1178 family protein [Pandoraea nosoerga]MBN4664961.1 DUF1178 family protein [Pandoraea nosoerga]MBN4675323.1 DUF1178 family protein [Pandoraea nosoerga]MBN4680704.1 DUF1178 family protein [Pandoraea nosoerga]MBN4745890.1 DUF1178 family protein [Pandoraea nosoerga]VVD90629.1 hypothetical protein PNO31109_01590 [Pandoraea nosoerga]